MVVDACGTIIIKSIFHEKKNSKGTSESLISQFNILFSALSINKADCFHKGWSKEQGQQVTQIPGDTALPHLSTLLESGAMAEIIKHSLYQSEFLEYTSCEISYVHYKPMRECLVCYSIRIKEAATGRTLNLLVTAKTFAEEPSADFLNRLPRHLNGTPEFGLPFAYIPEKKIILTAFPNDLKLRNLQKYLGQETIDSVIKEEPGSSFKNASKLKTNSIYFPDAIMSYKPERSCLFRYQTVVHEAADHQTIFGRVYSSRRGKQVFQGMIALWKSDVRKKGQLTVAEPLAYDAEKKILYQSEVRGFSLADFVSGEEFSDDEFFRIIKLLASSVAALHLTPERIERSGLPGNNLEARQETVNQISGVVPDAASRLNTIIGTLTESCPELLNDDLSLIHGDLSINQVMVEENQVGLVDFDLMCVGDSHQDIASFLVRLENLVYKKILKEETAKKAAQVFTRQYENARETSLVPERLLWHQAAEYVRLSLYIIKQLKPGWRHALMNSIQRAEDLLLRM